MDGYASMFGPEADPADKTVKKDAELQEQIDLIQWASREEGPEPGKSAEGVTTVGDKAKKFANVWKWEVQDKPKRDKVADPRLRDRVGRFFQFWDWKLAPSEGKPIKIPTIGDIVSLDRKGWELVSKWAGIIGVAASLFNLLLVTIYACTVASKSHFVMLEEAHWVIRGIAWFSLMCLATGIAGVLQLATDFGLPWASGLAFEKYKISPTAIILAWLILFLPTTLIMKFDLYSSWGHERQAELVLKQTESANDQVILNKYAASPPPAVEASEAIIAASPALLLDMRAERDRLVAARDQEKEFLGNSRTGMGQRWRELNSQVEDITKRIEAQVAKETAAATAKKDRQDYDAAKMRSEANAKVTANNGAALRLLYDHPVVIWLRVLGGAFVSIIAILVHFVALKKAAEERDMAEAKAKKSESGKKGWDTRKNKPTDVEFEEAAPLDSRAIPDFGPITSGPVARADTGRRVKPGPPKHPDRAGDDFGAQSNGHEPKPEAQPDADPTDRELLLSELAGGSDETDLTDQTDGDTDADEPAEGKPGQPADQ